MLQTVTHFVQHANPLLLYLTVMVLLLLESSGVPVANTTVLLFTGAMASLGHLDIMALACAALSGSMAGACLAYVLGERGRRRTLLRIITFFHINPGNVLMVERWFHKSGIWMIFFSRIIPYVRPFACFPAGISRLPFGRFFLATLLGSAIWCIGLLTVGWNLGRRWKLALSAIQTYTLPTLSTVVLLIAIYTLMMFMIKRNLARKFHPAESVECSANLTGDLLEV